jgi:hypothetical protein
MKIQTPAEGIMITGDYGDSKFYKVVCSCGQPDHDIDFEVEAAETGVNVNTYVTTKTDYWTETVKKRYDIDSQWLQELDWVWKDLINGLVTRVKLTWTVWTKGYIETQTTTAMTEQQAINYAETLKSAVDDVKKFRSKNDPTTKATSKIAVQGDCV